MTMRTIYLVITGFIMTISSCAQQENGPIPDSTFPGVQWEAAEPETLGYSSKRMKKAKEQFEDSGGEALLVIVKGYIIADWGATEASFDGRSFRKSLLSSLYGIYVNKGEIDLNRTLGELDINDAGKLTEQELETPIKYLLSSSSGIYLPAAFEEPANRNKPGRGSDKPGERFIYNNWDFNALSTIFNNEASIDLFEAFDRHIAQPLQMEHFSSKYSTVYLSQPTLSEHPAYLFQISTKDMARFGLLYLNEGNWRGNQLVPKDWVLESTSPQIETGEKFYYDYGYLWWVSKRESKTRRPFLSRGAQSQYMYVDPSNELIIVFRDNPNDLEKVSKGKAYPIIGSIHASRID